MLHPWSMEGYPMNKSRTVCRKAFHFLCPRNRNPAGEQSNGWYVSLERTFINIIHLSDRVDRISSLLAVCLFVSLTFWCLFKCSFLICMDQEVGHYPSQVKNEIEKKIFTFIQMQNAATESVQIGKDTSNSSFILDFSYHALLTLMPY